MPFVGGEVALRQVSAKDWRLLEDLVYEGKQETLRVHGGETDGFKTDLASVPRAFTWLIPRYGRYTRAAILHDFLCREAHAGRFSRYDADGIFRRTMRELGVGFLRRWLMWIAVRFGAGWRSFWERGVLRGLWVLVLGLVAFAFLAIPLAVVGVWLAAFWVLEWVVFGPLKAGSRKKQVNVPRGLSGT